MRTPLAMLHSPFRSGSYIMPFQPRVVRGFSKYARMTTRMSWETFFARSWSLAAYWRAASRSWMEQGPTSMRRRLSRPSRMSRTWARISWMFRRMFSVNGSSWRSSSGDFKSISSSIVFFLLWSMKTKNASEGESRMRSHGVERKRRTGWLFLARSWSALLWKIRLSNGHASTGSGGGTTKTGKIDSWPSDFA